MDQEESTISANQSKQSCDDTTKNRGTTVDLIENSSVDFCDKSVRLGFLSEWFGWCVAVFLSILLVILVIFYQDRDWSKNPSIPTSLTVMGILAIFIGIPLGCASAWAESNIILYVLVLTLVLCLANFMLALQPKWNIDIVNGILFSVIALSLAGLALYYITLPIEVIQGPAIAAVICSLILIIYITALLHAMMAKSSGQGWLDMTPADYVRAVISIYFGIVGIAFISLVTLAKFHRWARRGGCLAAKGYERNVEVEI